MTDCADLELGLHRRDSETYVVEFRFSLPGSDTEIRRNALANLDLEDLRAKGLNQAEHGQALFEQLFAEPAALAAFREFQATAASQDYPLRVRLLIGPSAVELNQLHWETLFDPDQKSFLFTDENVHFSRYLASLDWRPVRLRSKGELRALAMVANPSNLADFDLAPVDVAGETERARTHLADLRLDSLPAEGKTASLENLVAALREQAYDVLYLVAHGAIVREEPWLFLEDAQGQVGRISGSDLATRLRELPQRPRLVVLASCQSASDRGAGVLSALGPRLSEAGIPAVVAMQGNISMQTIAQFMPVFFKELNQDGQIDRAMAVARAAVRSQPDFWMPTLFMRLKSGRIWYVPGFGEEGKGFEKWPALIRSIKRGQCTPILGPGLYEAILGSQREIAQRWAENYHYPMAPHERESLPQVSQYLAINQDRNFPYDELGDYLKNDLQTRYSNELPAGLQLPAASLDQIINQIGKNRRLADPIDPFRVLAQLPLPIYITTNSNNLIAEALKEAGKDPQVLICPWNEYVEQAETIYDREPDYRPSAERPLVYHLFGRLDERDSVVLTEDDYFDFLIGVTSNKDLIPSAVRRAMADTALLFLGFQMDDWNFRVLFRSILAQQGGGRRDRYAHIAAQIVPEEGRILEPERARRYLENYFAKGADISLYWGSADDFVSELLPRWSAGG